MTFCSVNGLLNEPVPLNID